MSMVIYILGMLSSFNSSTKCDIKDEIVTCTTQLQDSLPAPLIELRCRHLPEMWIQERGVVQSAVIEVKPLTIDEEGCRVYRHMWRVYREPCKI